MRKNTDKDNSTLHLTNVNINPVDGSFTADSVDALKMSYDSREVTVTIEYNAVDYEQKFEEKHEGMHDIVADGDGLTKDIVRDLVMTANKAIWQESKDESR